MRQVLELSGIVSNSAVYIWRMEVALSTLCVRQINSCQSYLIINALLQLLDSALLQNSNLHIDRLNQMSAHDKVLPVM